MVEAEQPDPMEGMTEEEKEEEACRLIDMINRLSRCVYKYSIVSPNVLWRIQDKLIMYHSPCGLFRDQIIQPVGVTADGRLAPLWGKVRGYSLEEEEDTEEEELDLMSNGRKDKQMKRMV